MIFKLDKRLFPNSPGFERRRKLADLCVALFFAALLMAGVAYLMVRLSGTGISLESTRGNSEGKPVGQIPGLSAPP